VPLGFYCMTLLSYAVDTDPDRVHHVTELFLTALHYCLMYLNVSY